MKSFTKSFKKLRKSLGNLRCLWVQMVLYGDHVRVHVSFSTDPTHFVMQINLILFAQSFGKPELVVTTVHEATGQFSSHKYSNCCKLCQSSKPGHAPSWYFIKVVSSSHIAVHSQTSAKRDTNQHALGQLGLSTSICGMHDLHPS